MHAYLELLGRDTLGVERSKSEMDMVVGTMYGPRTGQDHESELISHIRRMLITEEERKSIRKGRVEESMIERSPSRQRRQDQ
jgi:hypothetical protein